jgi:acyl-CoA reductase-like NAD-dependent aldehyde dehydrogenase
LPAGGLYFSPDTEARRDRLGQGPDEGAEMVMDKDLLSVQQARILAENAREAQKALAAFPQEKLDAIVEGVADAVGGHLSELARMSYEETEYGRWRDKLIKNRFVCNRVRRALRGMRCVGVIGEDPRHGLMDIGVPVGVIAALCPATSPVSTSIYKTLIALKAGNAIIFSPHPRAPRSIGAVLDIMMEAAQQHGLPKGSLSYLSVVSRSGTLELMRHSAVSLNLITGVSGMYREAHGAQKPIIYGGMGNGPVFIERTADVRRAVADIVRSKSFDNGTAPGAELAVVVDACIAADVRRAFQDAGAHFMTEEESLALADALFTPDGRRKERVVGQSAVSLARRAGFAVPPATALLMADRKYVYEGDPYAREMLSPVLACYVENDWMHACEKCIELLLHERKGHTLAIHSRDEEVIRQFALKKPVGRLLVNTPASLGGMGMTTDLFPAMTLGGGSAGYGITSDNVSPRNLMYIRKVGHGMRRVNGEGKGTALPGGGKAVTTVAERRATIRQILAAAIAVVDGSANQ